jgi:hypothetical protein
MYTVKKPRFLCACMLLIVAALHCARSAKTVRAEQSTSGKSETAQAVPLCSLVSHPATYDGKRVTVAGCVTTDGSEYVVLSNLESPCPEGGVVPLDDPKLSSAEAYEAVPGKKVCGAFTGTFRASTALYNRVLEVEGTSGLRTSALE